MKLKFNQFETNTSKLSFCFLKILCLYFFLDRLTLYSSQCLNKLACALKLLHFSVLPSRQLPLSDNNFSSFLVVNSEGILFSC